MHLTLDLVTRDKPLLGRRDRPRERAQALSGHPALGGAGEEGGAELGNVAAARVLDRPLALRAARMAREPRVARQRDVAARGGEAARSDHAAADRCVGWRGNGGT